MMARQVSATPRPLLIDTHYWIWLQGGAPGRISPQALKEIQSAAQSGRLLLSVVSVWEPGMLTAKKRIHLTLLVDRFVRDALATPGMILAPLTPEIALDSTQLPDRFHGDPADGILAATARHHAACLLTADEQLARWCRGNSIVVV